MEALHKPELKKRAAWMMFWAVIICALGGLAYLDYPALSHTQASAAPANSSLELSVQRAENSLVLAWDPGQPALRNAAGADVLIEDGPHRTKVALAPDQIGNGALQYAPFTKDVLFHMTAYDSERHDASGTLRVLNADGHIAASHPVAEEPETAVLPPAPRIRQSREPRAYNSSGRDGTAANGGSRQYYAVRPGTVVLDGTLVKDTPVRVRVNVDRDGRIVQRTQPEGFPSLASAGKPRGFGRFTTTRERKIHPR